MQETIDGNPNPQSSLQSFERVCPVCKKQFTTPYVSKIYCSKKCGSASAMLRHVLKDRDGWNRKQRVKNVYIKDKAYDVLGRTCVRCGDTGMKHLTIDHIIPVGSKNRRWHELPQATSP